MPFEYIAKEANKSPQLVVEIKPVTPHPKTTWYKPNNIDVTINAGNTPALFFKTISG